MSGLPHFDPGAIAAACDMATAIATLRNTFADLGPLHHRSQVPLGPADDLLMMPAVTPEGIGVKIVTVVADNPSRGLPLIHGHYLLCDGTTGAPVATLDGTALTSLRTPAASAVATDALARPDATALGIFGTGAQARGHVEAMLCVRPDIDTVLVSGRTPAASEAFAASVDARGRTVVAARPDRVATADIVCGCTSSATPVVPTPAVRPGTHVNLVGSYSTARREVDDDLVESATVYVDERSAAAAEAGELIHAAAGDWSFDRIAGDLADLARGDAGRRHDAEITLFKSVGLAVEDVAVAVAVMAATR